MANDIAESLFKSKIKKNNMIMVIEKNLEIVVPLKYISNFWGTLEMPLINCEISLDLTWPKTCAISSSVGKSEFAITDTKLYVPSVTLLTEDNAKFLK